MNTIALQVEHIDPLTPRVRRLLLKGLDGTPLPAYAPGSHIELHVPASGPNGPLHRAYSLVRPVATADRYEIAVQLEETGTGGSRWVHQLQVGDRLDATPPRNHFPMHGEAQRPLLLAAGIGITPILCMALALRERGLPFDLHYVARDAAQAAYAADVQHLDGATCWFDGGDPRRGLPLAEVIGRPLPGRHLHVCGPKGFITATLDTARDLGWPEAQLHCELFTGTLAAAGDRAFTVELKASGMTLAVPVGKSVMDVMEDAGLDPMFDCRRGDCGICVAQVIDGEADHRDHCLSARDRQSGSFCTCVSRARSERLVLDL
jgi:vanillate O-demethylase ferredoxin subunit